MELGLGLGVGVGALGSASAHRVGEAGADAAHDLGPDLRLVGHIDHREAVVTHHELAR